MRLIVEEDSCISPGALAAHDASLGINAPRTDSEESIFIEKVPTIGVLSRNLEAHSMVFVLAYSRRIIREAK